MDYNIPNPPNQPQDTQTPPPSAPTPPPGGYGTFDPPPGAPVSPPPGTYQPPQKDYRKMAITSLVLGICAAVVPIPVLDVIAGIIGIILAAVVRKNEAPNRNEASGIAMGALALSIIGTIQALAFTVQFFTYGWEGVFGTFARMF